MTSSKTVACLRMLRQLQDAGKSGVHEDTLCATYALTDRKLRRYVCALNEAGWRTTWRGAGTGRRLVLLGAL